MDGIRFEPAELVNLIINVLAVFGAIAGFYYRMKQEIADLKAEIRAMIREKEETHERLEKEISDHEVRLRILERGK